MATAVFHDVMIYGVIHVISRKSGKRISRFPMVDTRTKIGSHGEADIRITLPSIASQHARLTIDDAGKLFIENISHRHAPESEWERLLPVTVGDRPVPAGRSERIRHGETFRIGQRAFAWEQQTQFGTVLMTPHKSPSGRPSLAKTPKSTHKKKSSATSSKKATSASYRTDALVTPARMGGRKGARKGKKGRRSVAAVTISVPFVAPTASNSEHGVDGNNVDGDNVDGDVAATSSTTAEGAKTPDGSSTSAAAARRRLKTPMRSEITQLANARKHVRHEMEKAELRDDVDSGPQSSVDNTPTRRRSSSRRSASRGRKPSVLPTPVRASIREFDAAELSAVADNGLSNSDHSTVDSDEPSLLLDDSVYDAPSNAAGVSGSGSVSGSGYNTPAENLLHRPSAMATPLRNAIRSKAGEMDASEQHQHHMRKMHLPTPVREDLLTKSRTRSGSVPAAHLADGKTAPTPLRKELKKKARKQQARGSNSAAVPADRLASGKMVPVPMRKELQQTATERRSTRTAKTSAVVPVQVKADGKTAPTPLRREVRKKRSSHKSTAAVPVQVKAEGMMAPTPLRREVRKEAGERGMVRRRRQNRERLSTPQQSAIADFKFAPSEQQLETELAADLEAEMADVSTVTEAAHQETDGKDEDKDDVASEADALSESDELYEESLAAEVAAEVARGLGKPSVQGQLMSPRSAHKAASKRTTNKRRRNRRKARKSIAAMRPTDEEMDGVIDGDIVFSPEAKARINSVMDRLEGAAADQNLGAAGEELEQEVDVEAEMQAELEAEVEAAAPTTPKAATPKAKTPKAKTPKSATPKAATPKAKTPKAKTPKAKTPKAKTPKAKTPKAKTPKAKTKKPVAAAVAVDVSAFGLAVYEGLRAFKNGRKMYATPLMRLPPKRTKAYYAAVSEPIDMTTVHKQVNDGHYESAADVRADFERVINNTMVGFAAGSTEHDSAEFLLAKMDDVCVEAMASAAIKTDGKAEEQEEDVVEDAENAAPSSSNAGSTTPQSASKKSAKGNTPKSSKSSADSPTSTKKSRSKSRTTRTRPARATRSRSVRA